MTKYHSHHTTPVHLGGKDSPQVLLTPTEHAELHAQRFLDGLDNGFHMGLLVYLDDDTELLVRQQQSELMRTEWNPGYGTSFVKDRQCFTAGETEVLEFERPAGFKPGRLPG